MVRRLAVLALLAASCGAAPRRAETLVDEARRYNEGVRWRRYEHAAAQIAPVEREAFLDERDALDEDLRIDDYEIVRVHTLADESRARIQIAWTWHLDSRGIVHRTVTRQAWERHGKRWLMVGEVRVRGDKMPGVSEPKPEESESGEKSAAGL